MFKDLKKPKNLLQYRMFKGITDFGNATQFDLFETGYSFLVVCKVPRFIEKLASKDSAIQELLNNYVAILENEFKGLSGIDNITSETSEISDGISTLNVITKVTEQSASTITMNFTEKSGSTITKFHKYYLSGIKDPRSQARTYHGLLKEGVIEPDYANEVFTLLYIVTDNTYRNIEAAYLLLNTQITTAETNMYETTKGDISFKELSVEMNCFPVTGDAVNEKAKKVLDWMLNEKENDKYVPLESDKFIYNGTNDIDTRNGGTSNSENQ